MHLPFIYGAALGILLVIGIWHAAYHAGVVRERLLRRRVARMLREARRVSEDD